MVRALAVGVLAAGLASGSWASYAQSVTMRGEDPPQLVIVEPFEHSDIPLELMFVPTPDDVYTVIGVRRPKGAGPFPAVLFASGGGSGGLDKVRADARSRAYIMERFLGAGYVVATLQYRNEVAKAYNKLTGPQGNIAEPYGGLSRLHRTRPALDHDDYIAIVEYVKRLPFVDGDRVGLVGSSHGGELILKAASEIEFAAAVANEPATIEFLSIDVSDFEQDADQPIPTAEDARRLANKAEAMERIRRIRSPIRIQGRAKDHFLGLYRLTYEWLHEAGKDVEWKVVDHPVHSYIYKIPRRDDGTFEPDPIQRAAIDDMLAYFNAKMRATVTSR